MCVDLCGGDEFVFVGISYLGVEVVLVGVGWWLVGNSSLVIFLFVFKVKFFGVVGVLESVDVFLVMVLFGVESRGVDGEFIFFFYFVISLLMRI